jgi:hypothetical protein
LFLSRSLHRITQTISTVEIARCNNFYDNNIICKLLEGT